MPSCDTFGSACLRACVPVLLSRASASVLAALWTSVKAEVAYRTTTAHQEASIARRGRRGTDSDVATRRGGLGVQARASENSGARWDSPHCHGRGAGPRPVLVFVSNILVDLALIESVLGRVQSVERSGRLSLSAKSSAPVGLLGIAVAPLASPLNRPIAIERR